MAYTTLNKMVQFLSIIFYKNIRHQPAVVSAVAEVASPKPPPAVAAAAAAVAASLDDVVESLHGLGGSGGGGGGGGSAILARNVQLLSNRHEQLYHRLRNCIITVCLSLTQRKQLHVIGATATTSVRENVCISSKKRKKSCFFGF